LVESEESDEGWSLLVGGLGCAEPDIVAVVAEGVGWVCCVWRKNGVGVWRGTSHAHLHPGCRS